MQRKEGKARLSDVQDSQDSQDLQDLQPEIQHFLEYKAVAAAIFLPERHVQDQATVSHSLSWNSKGIKGKLDK